MIERCVEFLIIFLVIYGLYYFTAIKKCKNNKKYVPVEVSLIISKFNIDIDKTNLYQMTKNVCLFTSIILSFSIVLVEIFINNSVLTLVFALLMALILAVIIYGFIGNYYKKKEEKN